MVKFDKILETDNVADLLSEEERFVLGDKCYTLYEQDDVSCSEYRDLNDKITKLLSPFLKAKDTPYPNSSNMNVPLVLNACIAFSSRAYGILFKDDKVCHAKVVGDDSGLVDLNTGEVLLAPNAKKKRAERVSEFLSYQLMYEDVNWEEDTDKLLLQLAAYGEMYRQRYFDSVEGKQKSEIIHPNNLILHADTTDFDKARKTKIYSLYPYEIKSNILSGVFVNFEYDDSNEDEEQHEFLEQYTRVDLDDDGYAEPYIITIHSPTRNVVRIVKAFEAEGVTYDGKDILNIEQENYFVRYTFLPNPSGKFHGVGFGYLLYDINHNINGTFNQINDAGKLANMPVILMGRGIRMKGGKMPLSPGKATFVDSSGRALRDNVHEIRFPEPSGTLYNLAQFLLNFGKELGGIRDVLSGEMRSDLPANTALALIEQGMNEFKSIFKRIYRAMSREFKLLYKLDTIYLPQDEYRIYGDGNEYNVAADFEGDSMDIVPVSDFSALTNIEKQYKATALREMLTQGMPINPQFVTRYNLDTLNIGDIEEAMNVQPSNQEIELQQTVAQIDLLKERNRQQELSIKMAELGLKEEKQSIDNLKTKAQIIEILEQAEAHNEGAMLDNIQKVLGILKEGQSDRQSDIRGMAQPRGNQTGMGVSQGLEGASQI